MKQAFKATSKNNELTDKVISFTVSEECELLEFLLEHVKGKSRNNIKAMLSRGDVTVNGKVKKHYDFLLRASNTVEIGQKKQAYYQINPLLDIIYEDDDIVVINKPSGLLSMSTDKEKDNTAYHYVTDYVKLKNQNNRVFIVHRLDRETSGIIMFAKSQKMKFALQEHWNELVQYRGYTAVVEGKPEKDSGKITTWLKETTTHFVYSSGHIGDGLEAITNYRVIKQNDEYSLLEVWLDTGRKNQIRVHMSEMGNPIAGDKKYDAQTNPIKRICLHANKLEFKHPFTGEIMSFQVRSTNKMLALAKNKNNVNVTL
ncbi:MAG: RluA family pseudouridine synthase [Oscillospiraceae bacterium]